MTSVNELLEAALKLPDAERLLVATKLLDSLPEPIELEDDPELLRELNRRANDPDAGIPAAEIWNSE